jgi:hypothetical protein
MILVSILYQHNDNFAIHNLLIFAIYPTGIMHGIVLIPDISFPNIDMGSTSASYYCGDHLLAYSSDEY